MKKRISGLLAALALCLALLPGAALAEGETGVKIGSVDLVAGKTYVVKPGNNIESTDASGEELGENYLEYDGTTLTVHGAIVVTATITVNSDLTITGDEDASLKVNGAVKLGGGSTLTLDGGVYFVASYDGPVIRGDTSSGSTFAATGSYSGDIVLSNSGGAPAVMGVPLDVKNSGSITITGMISSTESAVLNSVGNVSITSSTGPILSTELTIKGADVKLINNISGLSSSSVFNGGSLNIEATGNVVITNESGIAALAPTGSAVISAGGDVTISSGAVPLEGGDGLTVKGAENVTITGKSSGDDPFFSVPVTFENCEAVTVTDTGNGDFLGADGAITSDIPVYVTQGGAEKLYTGGELWDFGGPVPPTIQSSVTSPTAYKSGDGWVFYEPAAGGVNARLTLDNATGDVISFDQGVTGDVSIVAKGKNTVRGITVHGSVTIAEGADTLNTVVQEIITGADGKTDTSLTVYGKAAATGNWILGEHDGNTTSLTIREGAELTIPSNMELHIKDFASLKNNGVLVNNSTIALEGAAAQDADAETVKGLNLSGAGKVTVEKEGADGSTVTESYSNKGKPLLAAVGMLSLQRQTDSITEETTWNTKGYRWEVVTDGKNPPAITGGTLTLREGFNASEVILPGDGAEVTVKAEGDCLIGELGYQGSGGAGASTSIKLTFEGGKLTVAQPINFCGDVASSVTIAENAVVEANGGISVGAAAGVDGTVTVNGTLTARGERGGAAVLTGKVSVGPSGKLEVYGETGVSLAGMNTGETDDEGGAIMDFADAFLLASGGRFTGDCANNIILASKYNGAAFEESLRAEDVISIPSGYLPQGRTPEFNEGRTELTIPGGGPFNISSDNLPRPSGHTHKWAEGWTTSATHHWHNCTASGCPVTADSEKNGYGQHAYDGGWDADCNVCGYTRSLSSSDSSGSSGSSSRGGGGGSRPTSPITVEPSEHGTVTSDRSGAVYGGPVTLTVRPDSGYELESLTVTDRQGNKMKLSALGGGKYAFTMPGGAVTVRAAFTALEEENCPSRAFPDLDTGAWYHEAVDYVLSEGLMNGYADGTFRPNSALTRAQFVQILYNQAGRPAVTGRAPFTDVAPDAWCAPAVAWAAERGIAGGYGGGRFGPDEPVTREQLAVMLWRYAGSPAAAGQELDFSDADRAGGYAREALRWAVQTGVMNGKTGGVLDPKGFATRAQAAQMLRNFMENG